MLLRHIAFSLIGSLAKYLKAKKNAAWIFQAALYD